MVFQNPDNQLIATVVEEDVAFGPENLGLPSPKIIDRVEESLGLNGNFAPLEQNISALGKENVQDQGKGNYKVKGTQSPQQQLNGQTGNPNYQ